MTDEKNQQQVPPVAPAEAVKTETEQEKHVVSKDRFNEVNEAKKELEVKLAAYEAEKADAEKKALEESGKFKELYEKEQAEKARLENEVLKRDLISEAITSKKLSPHLTKLVTGSTKEDIEKSIVDALAYQEDLTKQIKDGTKADDDAGNGTKTPKTPMSQEEWMRLYEKDPKEANRVLKEMTEAAQK
jgi:hypothetical protein